MYVYRIEHKENIANNSAEINIHRGPYSYYGIDSDNLEKHFRMSTSHSKGNHPNIWADIGNKVNIEEIGKFYCGCPNLDILKDWFKGYVSHLLRNDFQIVEYKVTDQVLGWSGRQSFFKPEQIISKKVIKTRK